MQCDMHLNPAAAAFELDGLAFSVEGRRLLQPLDRAVPSGRVIALVGHNGSGKSTLLRLMARQDRPTAGTIRFQGRSLLDWHDRAFARKVAYLPQQPSSATGMLVEELVALGRYPWHGALGRFRQADRDKVAEALDLTGMTPFANRLADTLSGGERQRAWLAMMIAQDTEYLLLDEPTSALDVAHQTAVLALVQRLARERGLGLVIVLHDVNMAARYCDEIIALHTGRLIARGAPAELMRGEQLQAIYDVPMGVLAHPVTGAPISYVQ